MAEYPSGKLPTTLVRRRISLMILSRPLKMVPFYGTVYKSSLYDLIIPFPACESGAEREKRRAVVFASGKTGKTGKSE